MMPPTSIDGTDITGATIDGQDVQEITVDGQTVFSATVLIPDSEIDHFNRANLNDQGQYSGDTGNFSTDSNTVSEGSHSLFADMTSNTSSDVFAITSTSGLNTYPSRGIEIKYQFRFDDNGSEIALLFGVQSEVSPSSGDWYEAHHHNDNGIILYKRESGSLTELDSTSVANYDKSVWYQGRVSWGSPTITVEDETNANTASASDSTFDSGGIGYLVTAVSRVDGSSSTHDSYLDEVRTGSLLS